MVKAKKGNKLITLFIIILLITLVFSSIKFFKWYKDSKKVKALIEEINKIIEVSEIVDSEDVYIIEPNENESETEVEPEPEKPNPYWDYTKINLIDVDFSSLETINSDTVGWVQVPGTNINYPFVQTSDNDYYLNHSFDKTYNGAGWVFMDYRNNAKEFGKNTIIYGHNRADKTMFYTLKNALNNDWINNSNNHFITLSTKNENTLWQVFSAYHIKTTNDYIQTEFNSDEDFQEFLSMIQSRSAYNFDITVNENDKILTLSTCHTNNEKMVVHAKLVKYSLK